MVKLRQRKLIVSDCSSYLWWYCVNLLTVNIIRVKSTEHRLPLMFYKCKCWTLGSFPVVVVASRRRSGTRCVYLWRWSCTWNIVCLVCRLSFLLGSWFCKKNKIIKMVLCFFAVFGGRFTPKAIWEENKPTLWVILLPSHVVFRPSGRRSGSGRVFDGSVCSTLLHAS